VSKKGLGRGLNALITERDIQSSEIKEIMLTDIFPNPQQPRKDFPEDKLNELAASIREHGLLQPILVKPEGNRYYIIAGERRYRAARLAGLDRINCIITDCSPQEMAEKALIENIQRDDLSPVEEGFAYARLINEYGLTQEQIAKRVGKGRPTISNLLRIIQLPQEILSLIEDGSISLGHAKILLSVENTEERYNLANKIAQEALSVRELEELVRKSPEKKNIIVKHTDDQPKKYNAFSDIEDKLRNTLQTKVSIKGRPGRGKIEIDFYSEEELNRLLEIFSIEA